MSQINEKMSTKPAQYTRKKIENYSYGLNDVIGKGYSSQVYKGRNDANGKLWNYSRHLSRDKSHRSKNVKKWNQQSLARIWNLNIKVA